MGEQPLVSAWLTVREVAALKGCSAAAVYRAIREGRLVHERRGGSIRIPRRAARDWQPRRPPRP